jgi:hypothetical protein
LFYYSQPEIDWDALLLTPENKVDTIRPSDVHLYSHLDPMETSGTKGARAAAGGGMQWCYAVRSCR